jgi:hypothetical protein
MESAVRIGWRDRIGASLRESRLLTIVELLAVLLFLALQAAGAIAKPKLPMLLIGWLSLWLRRVSWRQLGLARPKSWLKTVLAGVGIGLAYNALDIRVILPLLHRLTGEPLDLSGVGDLQGNVAALATLVLASWISAALAEELLYRGYLLNRVTDVFGVTRRGGRRRFCSSRRRSPALTARRASPGSPTTSSPGSCSPDSISGRDAICGCRFWSTA